MPVRLMVSRDAYTSKNIVKKDIRLGEIEAEPSEVLQRALAGKILSDVFFRKSDEEELENHSGRRTRLTFIGTQCLFYDFDDASCDIDEFVSRLRIKPTFGYTTLSDGKIENGRKLHKFRLGYILSDFVYGLDNRERLWKEIARENNIVPTFIKGKKVQGEQDKYDKGCTSVQWFFGTSDKARTVFFPENIYQVPTELVGLPLSYDEYLSYREESERITAERKRQIARNEHFWDNESNKYLYRETLKGSGWLEEDDTCGIRRYPYFDVTICGRMKSLKIAKTDEEGNILKKDNNIIYETRLKKKRKTEEDVVGYRYKYQVVPFRDGEHRRVKLYVAAQKMAENYNKLREKEPWHPELDDTILFYFLHSYAHTYFELEGKGNTITNDELADIAISVNDDYREGNDTSFFDRETRTKRRAEPMMSMRFSMLTQRQKSALITSQIKVEDVLNNFDWTLSPSDNLERLNGAEKGKMYGGRKMKDDKSLKTFFKKIRKAIECGIYTNKAGRVIYDFNNFNHISKEVIDSFITYFDFSFSSFFNVSGKKGSDGRRGEKRRIVMEALEGVERMSVRKTQAFLKERGIEASRGTVAEILNISPVQIHNVTSNNIKERTILSTGNNKIGHPDILKKLTCGLSAKDIALELGISWITVQRYIKKAKDAGIIRNEGSKKFPKWVMIPASGGKLTSKDTNINKEKQIKNTTIMNTSIIINENVPQGFGDNLPLDESAMSAYTGEYTDEDYINDTAPELPYTCFKTGFTEIFKDEVTIPFKSAIAENIAGEHIIPYIQPTPKKMTKTDSFENVRNYDSSSSRTEYATEPFDNAFKAKAKCVLDDSLLQYLPSSSNTIEEDMPEDIYNGTVSDINTGMYRSERNDITMGLLPTPEKRSELKAKLASIISKYDNDVVGFVKSCNGFYMRFSQVASGELFYYHNTWRKNMEIEMKCTDLLIEELFSELGEEEVVAA